MRTFRNLFRPVRRFRNQEDTFWPHVCLSELGECPPTPSTLRGITASQEGTEVLEDVWQKPPALHTWRPDMPAAGPA
mgnify:FL=1